MSPTAEEDSTTYGVHNQSSRMSAEVGTKAVGITQKIYLHVSNDCITLCGFKLEDLIQYLSCPDLLNLVFSCRCFYTSNQIWKKLCEKRYFVNRPFMKVSFKDTFLTMKQKHHELCRELKPNLDKRISVFSINNLQLDMSKMWEEALKKDSQLRTIMKSEGICRSPTSSEVVVFSAAKVIKKDIDYHAAILRESAESSETKDFRVGAEYFQIPLAVRIFDIVQTTNKAEMDNTLSNEKKAENLMRRLALYCNRLQVLNKSNLSLFHKVMTKFFSNYHSRELMTFTHKVGCSLSYGYDVEQNRQAKDDFERMCTAFLNFIDSTTHFWNIDNLETMRKWASMLQHEEKVIHFMTTLLVYINGFHQVLDFYPRQEEQVVDICKIKPSDDDIERRDQLGEVCFSSVTDWKRIFQQKLKNIWIIWPIHLLNKMIPTLLSNAQQSKLRHYHQNV